MANRVLCSTLSIPIPPTRYSIDQLLESNDGEKRRRLASLLSLSTPPTRASLVKDLVCISYSHLIWHTSFGRECSFTTCAVINLAVWVTFEQRLKLVPWLYLHITWKCVGCNLELTITMKCLNGTVIVNLNVLSSCNFLLIMRHPFFFLDS